jgi:hypothetical protein
LLDYSCFRLLKCLPNIHILHAHDYVAVLAQKGTIEVYNVDGIRIVHDLELSNDSLAHFAIRLNVDDLFQTSALNKKLFLGFIIPFEP